MAEYNPSKIIKDGNTYNFRDTTKIPLAGSNAISGSLIPATTDAYDLGGSQYQWNNAYIKSLTINGTAAGDILTHNASEFVDVSSNQTIGGVKTFSDSINNKSIQQFIFNKEYNDATDAWLGIHNYFDKNDTRLGFNAIGDFSGNRYFRWFVRGQSTNSVEADIFGFGRKINETSCMYINATLETDLIPTDNNSKSLGSSTAQWNNAYIKALTINGTAAGDILTHNASEFVPVTGGAVMSGNRLSSMYDSRELRLDGGSDLDKGASIVVVGKDNQISSGQIGLYVSDGSINKTMRLVPDGTWTWNGTACQITSDQRLKQQIAEIDDKLLDAWEDVELSQFKYNDAVEQKKDKARLHTGYVVQQIDKACKEHGVDISEYGLYCHEEYPERTEEVEVKQEDGTIKKETKVIREASEHYSLRYTEVYAVECMYLRRCIARLTARIEELEKGNNSK